MKNKYQKRGIVFLCMIFISFQIIGMSFSADSDHDGLDDGDEINLLNKHIPKLIFHSEETEKPYKIEDWFYKYKINLEEEEYFTFWYFVPVPFFPYVIPIPTERRSAETIQEDIKLTDLLNLTGDSLCLNPVGIKNIFSNESPYTIYGHCFKARDSFGTEYIELQYWIFYHNNDIRELKNIHITDKTGEDISKQLWKSLKINHLGDWEFIAIRLAKDRPYEPQQVYFSAHYPENWTDEQIRPWNEIEKYNETHPVVYVARDSHANYFVSGDHKSDINIPLIDYDYIDRTGGGESVIPQVINLGEKNAPLNNCDWIKYAGKWGTDKGSPKGPAYRDCGGIGGWDGMFVENPGDILNWVFFYPVSGGNVKIKIFTIIGELVREINEGYKEAGSEYTYIWDGKNDAGKECASGTYPYVVLIDDKKIKADKLTWLPGSNIIPLIHYSVGHTKIHIYTIGEPPELVRTLDEGIKPPGDRATVWDAKNDAGEKVLYQVYSYLIRVDGRKIKDGLIVPAYLRPYIYDVTTSRNSFSSNQTMTVSYKLSEKCKVYVKIHNFAGGVVRTIVDGVWQGAGTNSFNWDGKDDDGNDVPTGTYTFVISAFDQSFKPAIEVKEKITWQVSGYTIAYGPTPPMPRKGNVSFTDTVSPEISNVYVHPEAFSVVMGTTNVYFTLSEPSTIKFKIYDSQESIIREITEFFPTGQNIIFWDGKDNQNNTVPDGIYFYTIGAEDLSGNKSFERTGYVCVDNTPPEILMSKTTDTFSPFLCQSVTFYFSINEVLTALQETKLNIWDRDNKLVNVAYDKPEKSASITDSVFWKGKGSIEYNNEQIVTDGVFLYRLRTRDSVFNWAESTGTVTVDTTPPQITNLEIKIIPGQHPKPEVFTINDTTIQVKYDLTDNLSPRVDTELTYKSLDSITTIKRQIEYYRNNQTGLYESVVIDWDGKDDLDRYIPDGTYEVTLTATDWVGNKTGVIELGQFKVDRTPSYVKTVYTDRVIFYDAEPVSLFYEVTDTAKVSISVLDGAGKTLNTYNLTGEQYPEQLYSFVWDGKDSAGNYVSDGSYILQVKTTDDVGNESSRSVGVIKNYIPARISFPSDDYAVVSGTVLIRGDALDPGTDNPRDFKWYKLWYSTSEVTTITDPKVPSPGIWYPVVVPAVNQSPSDPNFPNSNVSYRAVTQDVLGHWNTGDLPAETVCTLLLVTEDKSGNMSCAPRKVTIGVTVASESTPAVSVTSPVENDTFTLNTETATLKIEYNLTSGGEGTGVSLEIFRVVNGNYTGIVRYEEWTVPYSQEPQGRTYYWDGKDFRRWYVESGDYIIRLTAKDSDGLGMDTAEVRISVHKTVGVPVKITKFESGKAFIAINELTTIGYQLSKVGSSTITVTDISNGEKATLLTSVGATGSIDWSSSQRGLYLFTLKTESTDLPQTKDEASFTVCVDGTEGTGVAQITSPADGSITQGLSNFNWQATAIGEYYPLQNFTATVKAKAYKTWEQTSQGDFEDGTLTNIATRGAFIGKIALPTNIAFNLNSGTVRSNISTINNELKLTFADWSYRNNNEYDVWGWWNEGSSNDISEFHNVSEFCVEFKAQTEEYGSGKSGWSTYWGRILIMTVYNNMWYYLTGVGFERWKDDDGGTLKLICFGDYLKDVEKCPTLWKTYRLTVNLINGNVKLYRGDTYLGSSTISADRRGRQNIKIACYGSGYRHGGLTKIKDIYFIENEFGSHYLSPGVFISQQHDTNCKGNTYLWSTFDAGHSIPAGTSITYEIGSYDNPGTSWDAIPSSQKQTITSGSTPTISRKRYFKCKASLVTDNIAQKTPVIYSITQNFAKKGTFISSSCNFGITPTSWGPFEVIESKPTGTNIAYATQSSDDEINWYGQTGKDAWDTVVPGGPISSPPKQYLRWKAVLTTADGINTPVIDEVRCTANWEPVIEISSYCYRGKLFSTNLPNKTFNFTPVGTPYWSIISETNPDVGKSIASSGGATDWQFQATTNIKDMTWTSARDKYLEDGKIRATSEFNNTDNSNYFIVESTFPTLISSAYLPSVSNQTDNESVFWKQNGHSVDNLYVGIFAKDWMLRLFYPDGSQNDSLVVHPRLSETSNNDTNEYDTNPKDINDNFTVLLATGDVAAKSYVEIKGSVSGTGLAGWTLFYQKSGDTVWRTIKTSTESVIDNTLVWWDVTGLNGKFNLKLLILDDTGFKENVSKLIIGKELKTGATYHTYVCAPYNKAYLDLFPDAVYPEDVEVSTIVTITPRKLSDTAIKISTGMPLPIGAIYDLQPKGLKLKTTSFLTARFLQEEVPTDDILGKITVYWVKDDGELEPLDIRVIDKSTDIVQGRQISKITFPITSFSYYLAIPGIPVPVLDVVKLLTNNPAMTISGIAEPQAEVEIWNDGSCLGRTKCSDKGEFIFKTLLVEGKNPIMARTVRWFNDREHMSEFCDVLEIVLDTTPPEIKEVTATPEIFTPDGDGIDDFTAIEFLLLEESNIKMEIFDSKGTTIRTICDEQGKYRSAGKTSVSWNGFDDNNVVAPNGIYKFKITVIDRAGNFSICIGIVEIKIIDTVPPTVRIVNPPHESKVRDTVKVIASAADNYRISRVEFYIDAVDNSVPNFIDYEPPYTYDWDTTEYAAGSIHKIGVRAYDMFDNPSILEYSTVKKEGIEFNYKITAKGTSEGPEYSMSVSHSGIDQYFTEHLYPPGGYKVVDWYVTDVVSTNGGKDNGTYIDYHNNRLVIKTYTSYGWYYGWYGWSKRPGGYSATYHIKTGEHWEGEETGSATITASDGELFIATSTLVAPRLDTKWYVTDDNPNVQTWVVDNKIYARLSYTEPPFIKISSPSAGAVIGGTVTVTTEVKEHVNPKILNLDYGNYVPMSDYLASKGYKLIFDNEIYSVTECLDYNIVMGERDTEGITKADLFNELYDAGYCIITQGNDTVNDIRPITRYKQNWYWVYMGGYPYGYYYKRVSFSLKGKVVQDLQHFLIEKCSNNLFGSSDFANVPTEVHPSAIVLARTLTEHYYYQFPYYGIGEPTYPVAVYLHEPGKGYWFHLQPEFTSSENYSNRQLIDNVIKYFAEVKRSEGAMGVTKRVDFYLDGNLQTGTTFVPYIENIDTRLVTDGKRNISVSVVDNVDNFSCDQVDVIVDNHPPSISVYSPNANMRYVAGRSFIPVKFSVHDSLDLNPTVKSYIFNIEKELSIDVHNGQNLNPFDVTPGSWSISVVATDWVGNTSSETIGPFEIIHDTQPPRTEIYISSPKYEMPSQVYITSHTPLFFPAVDDLTTPGDCAGLGVKETFMAIDSTDTFIVQKGTFTISAKGEHTIYYYSTDVVGNTEIIKSTVVVADNDPPEIKISSPVGGETFIATQDMPDIDYKATDIGPFGTTGYLILVKCPDKPELEGTKVLLDVDTGNEVASYAVSYSTSIEPLDLPYYGFYVLKVEATDWAGHFVSSQTARFEVIWDILPPQTVLGIGEPVWWGQRPYIRSDTPLTLKSLDDLVEVGDGAGLGVKYVDYWINSDKHIHNDNPAPAQGSVFSSTFTLTEISQDIPLSDGKHLIYYFAQDILGNIEEAKEQKVILDNTPPAVNFHPTDFLYQNNTTVYAGLSTKINVAANDPDQDFVYYDFWTGIASASPRNDKLLDDFEVISGSWTIDTQKGVYTQQDKFSSGWTKSILKALPWEKRYDNPPYTLQAKVHISSYCATYYNYANNVPAVAGLIYFRYQDKNNHYAIKLSAQDKSVQIIKTESTTGNVVQTLFVETPYPVSINRWYDVELHNSNDKIKIKIFGKELLEISDTYPFTTQGLGFGSETAVVRFAGLRITRPALFGDISDASGFKEMSVQTDGNAPVKYNFQPAELNFITEGFHTIGVSAQDNVTNTSQLLVKTLAYDGTSPKTVLICSENYYPHPTYPEISYASQRAIYGFETNDPEGKDNVASGIYSASYRVDAFDDATPWIDLLGTGPYPTFSFSEGRRKLDHYSTDNVLNKEAVHTKHIWVDGTAPVTTLTMTGGVQWTSSDGKLYADIDTQYVLTAEDPLSCDVASGIKRTQYRVDAGTWHVWDGTPIMITEGIRTIEYYSIDNVQNAEDMKTFVVHVDNTSPETTTSAGEPKCIQHGEPVSDAHQFTVITSNTQISILANDPIVKDVSSGVKDTYYAITHQSWTTYNQPFAITGPDGDYTVQYYSRDNVLNTEQTKSTIYTLDNTPPVAEIILPSEDNKGLCRIISGKTAIVGTVEDLHFKWYQLYWAEINTDTWNEICTKTYKEISEDVLAYWDTTGLPEGWWTIKLTAQDCVQNQTTDTVDVYIGRPELALEISGFNKPSYIVLDSTRNMYISDTNNDNVKKYDAQGNLLVTLSGIKQQSQPIPGRGAGANRTDTFNKPTGLALDTTGNLYVADGNNDRVIKFSSDDSHLFTLSGFNKPHGLATDTQDNLYVADRNNDRIQKFSPNGTLLMTLNTGVEDDGLNKPQGVIAVDLQERIYVTDRNNNRVLIYNSSGVFITQISSASGLNKPDGIVVNQQGYIYVSDTNNDIVCKFDKYFNLVATYDGTTKTSQQKFNKPSGVTIDTEGNLYVVDSNNDKMLKYTLPKKPGDDKQDGIASASLQTSNPTEFKLGEVFAYPNPAKGGMKPTLHIEVGVADRVEIKIFNIAAELVHSAEISGSSYRIRDNRCFYEYPWDVSNVASGVYIYCVVAEKQGYSPIKVIKKLAVIR